MGLRALDEQERRTNSLDSKAGVVLAASGVLAGFIFRSDSFIRREPTWIRIAIVAAITMTIVTALAAFTTRRYRHTPSLRLSITMMARDDGWVRWRFLGTMLESWSENDRKLARKGQLLSLSLGSLLGTTLLLAGSFLYTVL